MTRKSVEFIGQLVRLTWTWALHGDGKHKLHHGRWVLITFGTHHLKWDSKSKLYRHQFLPLGYLWSQQIESIACVKYAMFGLQIVANRFFGARLAPAVNISDHSDGLRGGMRFINFDENDLQAIEEEGADAEVWETPHMSDWAHLSVHYTQVHPPTFTCRRPHGLAYTLIQLHPVLRRTNLHPPTFTCRRPHELAYALIQLHPIP